MVFISVVRTRHVVEELCKIKINSTAFALRSPLALGSAAEDTDEGEAALFNFVDFADFGFVTSIPFEIFFLKYFNIYKCPWSNI